MKGDVLALSRMESDERRLSKAAGRIKKKLDRTKRNKLAALNAFSAVTPTLRAIDFANGVNLLPVLAIANVRAAILGARGEDGKRLFFCAELVQGFEEVVGLVAAPRASAATPEKLSIETSGGDAAGLQRVSTASVLLFSAECEVDIGDTRGTEIVAQKVYDVKGNSVFWVSAASVESADYSPPWGLGLNQENYFKIQRAAVAMLGARLLAESE
jgi:hypothetical protein